MSKLFYLLQWESFKNDKNAFYFILKALFNIKIFKFLSWLFGSVEKNGLIWKTWLISNFWRHNLVNKQLQYISDQYLTK